MNPFVLLAKESLKDFLHISNPRKDNKHHILAGLDWLCRAQDTTGDGGVAAWFSLIDGWQSSYIETTGYIINTFIDCSDYFGRKDLFQRAVKMADFLIKMQHKTGGYRTAVPSVVAESPPTVFNTGQDLLGMTAIYTRTNNKKYLKSAIKAADFLVSIHEKDGSWFKNTYGSMKHTYHTRVAWGILKVWQLTGDKKYLLSGRKNLNWAAQQQQKNGWFRQNHLPEPNPPVPYTHTIAYAIEGFLWSGLLLKDHKYLDLAAKAALPLAKRYIRDNFLPGTLDKKWGSNDTYTCLTGDTQLTLVWLELYTLTKKDIYWTAAHRMLEFLKSTQLTGKHDSLDIRGAIKGSLPVYGDVVKNEGYCRLAFLNWSTKFFIDALLTEQKIVENA